MKTCDKCDYWKNDKTNKNNNPMIEYGYGYCIISSNSNRELWTKCTYACADWTMKAKKDTAINIGDIIKLGNCEWRVLDVQSDRALIISENILEFRKYHNSNKKVTWEHSAMRDYLNNEFLNNTFTAEEQKRIIETIVINNKHPIYGDPDGNDTINKIFLLSIEEAIAYFTNNSARVAYGINGDSDWWWLRSPGYRNSHITFVDFDGNVRVNGVDVGYDDTGVRPALWIKI